MKLADFLAQTLPESSLEHISELRKILYANGHIKSLEQKTISGADAITCALEWYKAEMRKQDEKGSTGSYGKLFELTSRCRWAILHNQPMAIADIKCRPSKMKDMRIRLRDGRFCTIELKTGTGAIAYGSDPMDVLNAFRKLYKSNTLFVWDFDKSGCPIAMPIGELLELLDSYNDKGISTWVALNQDINGVWQYKLQPVSGKKAEWLTEQAKGADWDTVLETGELEFDE